MNRSKFAVADLQIVLFATYCVFNMHTTVLAALTLCRFLSWVVLVFTHREGVLRARCCSMVNHNWLGMRKFSGFCFLQRM